jgi:putative transposase
MCRVLGVSRSGFHAWQVREPSARSREDARLAARIRELFALRRKVYGSPRIWSGLVLDDGERIGRKRVERLMRQAGPSALMHKRWKATTVRVPGVRVADDLLDRDFAAEAPNRCWVADTTISEPGKAGCTWSPSKTSTAAGSSAGQWPITCAPSSSSTRCRWRSRTAGRRPD